MFITKAMASSIEEEERDTAVNVKSEEETD